MLKVFVALLFVLPAVAQEPPKIAPKSETPAKAGPPTEVKPGALVDVPDPTDGGVYHVRPELADAVRAMIAAKQSKGGPKAVPVAPKAGGPPTATDQGDLAEVNAQRAARGLPPYQNDPALLQAAQAAAAHRARNCIEGHCNDFSFLPAGVRAACAGCAAWRPGTGFGACDLYASWTFCGAASAIGADGRRYCHAFYR